MKTKAATAVRVDGNVYDVSYPGTADYDRRVSYRYLRLLAKRGYLVTVDQTVERGEGEPATYVVPAD